MTFLTVTLFFQRGKTLRLLTWFLIFNGIALATVGFAQIFTDADKILWFRESANSHFYASFVYKNHAAAYLNIILAASIGLYFFYRERAWRASSPHSDKSPIFFFSTLLLFTLILFSESRAGVVLAASLLLASTIFSLIHAWRWERLRETSITGVMYLGIFLVFCGVFVAVIGKDRVIGRFERLLTPDGELEMDVRMQAYNATIDMFRDNWVFGWGAGSFEYYFPVYQRNYPDIQFSRGHNPLPLRWDHAHNDWLQLLAEYGVVGVGIFLIGIIAWLWRLKRAGGLSRPLPLWLALAALIVFIHALIDFPLHNPAVLITLSAAAGIALQAASLERAQRERAIKKTLVSLPIETLPGKLGPSRRSA